MKVEDLLKLLADAGLDEKEIKNLLSEALASMPAETEENKAELTDAKKEEEEAGKLFGIDL